VTTDEIKQSKNLKKYILTAKEGKEEVEVAQHHDLMEILAIVHEMYEYQNNKHLMTASIQ
jgi:hypothetical protein